MSRDGARARQRRETSVTGHAPRTAQVLAGEADGAECAILAGATPLWLRLDARTGFDTCLGGCVLRSWLTETSVAPRATAPHQPPGLGLPSEVVKSQFTAPKPEPEGNWGYRDGVSLSCIRIYTVSLKKDVYMETANEPLKRGPMCWSSGTNKCSHVSTPPHTPRAGCNRKRARLCAVGGGREGPPVCWWACGWNPAWRLLRCQLQGPHVTQQVRSWLCP